MKPTITPNTLKTLIQNKPNELNDDMQVLSETEITEVSGGAWRIGIVIVIRF